MRKFSSPAKWILCGEHAVVRGGKAVAFPFRDYTCSIFERPSFLKSTSLGSLWTTIVSLIQIAAEFLNVTPEKLPRNVVAESDIPMKAGLGSSAALCASVARLLQHYGLCDDPFALAKRLENKFHGKSSGLDVAVALTNKPVVFQKNRATKFLEPTFWPYMILTYSGQKSATFDCVKAVNDLFLKNEKLAFELDERMNLASDLCEEAFKSGNFNKLKDGVNLANDVFRGWGLCDPKTIAHMEELFSNGAVAVKPIGSGLGGYILSLWEEKPKKYVDIGLTLKEP
ncbi:MAG: hypothetical protein LBL99_02350 [Holosporaceae bacterium]|jgi:mevalonate kinase|nr:hypothetical protein [Holosporaceae bacterium]